MAKLFVFVLVILALVSACGPAPAQDQKISIALSVGLYYPTDSAVQDEFDDSWTMISLKTFEAEKPMEWRFTAETGYYDLDGLSDAKLIPITAGIQRGLNERTDFQPYVALRGGPFYGKIEEPGSSESSWGLNLNASLGVTIHQRFFAEVRYDYFSEIEDRDFSGFSIVGGFRLFDLNL